LIAARNSRSAGPAYKPVPTLSSDGTPRNRHVQPMQPVTSAQCCHRESHPAAWVRPLHWINAVPMILMIMFGMADLQRSPLFDFRFSHSITLGRWLGAHCLAFRGMCVDGTAWSIGARLWPPPLRQEAAADYAQGVISDAGAAWTASCRTTTSPDIIMCRSCLIPASSRSCPHRADGAVDLETGAAAIPDALLAAMTWRASSTSSAWRRSSRS